MNRFLIARHGETRSNQERRLSGQIDTPLTVNGLVPTEAVIRKLQGTTIDRMYASDLGRAFITAYRIARGIGHTGEIVAVPGLREVDYGEAANMKSADAYKLYPLLDRDTHYTPPNGESLSHMQTRVLTTVNELDMANTDVTILLVAHSGVMAAINASYLKHDFGAHNISEAYPHDYLAEFTVADGTITSFAEVK
jgi:probable phosphoglycerate mutase